MPFHQAVAYRSNMQTVTDCAVILSASVLLALSAKLQIPFFPVPMTMQTFAVLGIGLMLGPVRGVLAVFTYLLEGVIGLPVFAGAPELGSGIAYLMGPTGGYLLGCVPAVLISGGLAGLGRDRGLVFTMGALIAALAAIYGSGLIWLGGVVGFDKPVLRLGFFPFILGDLVKATVVALAFHSIRKSV
ncbi:biotin transporter BioY [Bradyrhizobium liaoningense]|uniref:biotin transporter BioY n=1 Tax=Bradyrhizobium liaoningense TaxID=43992 RepID=UPI001BA9AAAF|nr:biotin transporter BioY [Bradyrhizobium liaoningense]MBR0857718.1 biotin transporter BioY [Bradyrhizobium liaoningense]